MTISNPLHPHPHQHVLKKMFDSNLDYCSDGVQVAHDEHEPGWDPLEHIQHPVMEIPDTGSTFSLSI